MTMTHRARVEAMLAIASANHAALLPQLPPEIRASLPVDAQGITEAIDFVAEAARLSSAERAHAHPAACRQPGGHPCPRLRRGAAG
jgi:hypothetical protein